MATGSNKSEGTDSSYEASQSGKVIEASADMSVSFDPEPEKVWKIPKSKFPKKFMRVHGEAIKALMEEDDVEELKNFLINNIDAITWGRQVRDDLAKLIKQCAPAEAYQIRDEMDAKVLMSIVADIFEYYQRKLALLDISLERSELLEGTALQIKIDESKKKISDLLESYQRRVNEAEDNVWHLQEIINENVEELKNSESRIAHLYQQLLNAQKRTYDEPKPDDTNFFAELKEHLERDLHLNSSFKEELAAEKRTKHSLFQEICRLKELRVYDEQEKMKEIAEIAKDMELDDGLKKLIVDKIQTLTPKTLHPSEIQKAVNDWMKEINSCIGRKETQMREMKETVKAIEKKIAQDTLAYQQASRQYEQLVIVMSDLDAEINEKLDIYESKLQELAKLDQSLQALDSKSRSLSFSPTRYYDAEESIRQSPECAPQLYETTSPLRYSPELSARLSHSTPPDGRFGEFSGASSPIRMRQIAPQRRMHSRQFTDSSGSYSRSFDFDESPEKLREGSPYRGETTYLDSISPIQSTPPSGSLSYTDSPGLSPIRMSIPLMQSYDENYGALERAPRTISAPGSSKGFTPGIARTGPSTQDLSQVKNRFTVGKLLNMRSVCTTSTPYKQLTRVSSLLPEPGESDRMIDHPLNITHSPQLTPTRFVTPFISKSRFGYTDPTVRVLNIPPGDDLDIPTEYERDILATSPKSVFQYPTPQELEISSHYTYGIPPAITPTTTRRRGLFTPTGIFRKRHFNLRKLFEPEVHESTIRSSRPYLDKSISWERSSDSPLGVTIRDKTFDGSPAMDWTFYASPPAAISRTFDASSPYGMDRTFTDYSPSYRERMFPESPAYEMDRTFSDYSPTTMVERFDVPPRNLMDRTFDASSPHPMDGTFEASAPHVMDKTFQASPPYEMNRSSETSPPYPMNRTFETYSPHPMERTFDVSSPQVMDRTFQASPQYAMNRTFNTPPSSSGMN